MRGKWMVLMASILSLFWLAACGGGDSSGSGQTPGNGGNAETIVVQGNLVGFTAAALDRVQDAAAGDAVAVMVDESRRQTASQTLSATTGPFSITVPTGHDYVMVFREGSSNGRTLAILTPDASGRTTITLATGSGDIDLGDIELDAKTGKARTLSEVQLAHPAAEFPDSDGDGIPDVGDNSADEDGDGVADSQDQFAFDSSESMDTDGDGIGDNADSDDDNDGIADAGDAFPKDPTESVDTDGDGIGDAADPDDDNDGIVDTADAFPRNPAESVDTDGDGLGDNLDLDDDNDGVADASDAFPKNPSESADTDHDGIGNNVDPDDDNDGLADAVDPFPLIAGDAGVVVRPPALNPLNQIPVPEPPQLLQFVKNKLVAIRLGKALFWDMQVGSDGIQACATCHFSAGADSRTKNQINPGTFAGDDLFGNNHLGGVDFPQFGPNYTLQPGDFPLHERQFPEDQASLILRDTNDVVGSQGVRLNLFVDVVPGSAVETLSAIPDPVFNDPINSSAPFNNTRRVEPRHTPTVINAVFNFTQFWDGRANFLFNGENAFGPADPDAGVWFNDPVQGLVKQPVEIQFAALASQAVTPPVSDFEMSARGRTFPMIGRKLLNLVPLAQQFVQPGDSVLGSLSLAIGTPGAKGLNTTYDQMIRDSFLDKLWNSSQLTPEGFTQMEANFSLFFGLAVQLYEATLVSDQTPFDGWLAGNENAITDQQKLGFNLFNGIANCTVCHVGVELTTSAAANIGFIDNFNHGTIELMFTADGTQAIYDEGFNNTSITPTTDDLCRGGTAPFDNSLTGAPYPLSFSGLAVLDAQGLLDFETPIMDLFLPPNIPVNKDGLFKVPGLRNVELTGPYFHNGSVATLAEVIDFYVRGGNFPQENIADLDPVIGEGLSLLQGKEVLHDALIAFLQSLTDPRVLAQSAPFDHPELFVPEGDPEILRQIPATDASGSAVQP